MQYGKCKFTAFLLWIGGAAATPAASNSVDDGDLCALAPVRRTQ
jgi:hypothetical protein